ncbi:MAG: HAMP domain-containing histidine kinase, partial [Turicibacter sp.]|nr:HAMP domain-containing histidine kinase [Turicibacter sp.]
MMMSIVTLIIGVIGFSNLQLKRTTDISSFQRLSMLLIDQLEADELNADLIIQSYESKKDFFCRLTDENGSILYQSLVNFKTSPNLLLNKLEKQNAKVKIVTLKTPSFTTHGGVFQLKGNAYDSYLGSSHEIITKNGTRYKLDLLLSEESFITFFKPQIPLYLFFWVLAWLSISLMSRCLLKKALAPTEDALQSQKNFIAAASHELKAPLSVIITHIETLKKDLKNNPSTFNHLHILDLECRRLSNLIKDLLTLASSDAKTWSLVNSEVNIDTLLINLYEKYEEVCFNKKIILTLDLSDKKYPLLYTDQERLLQILCIYLENAIHHAKQTPSIEIKTALTAKNITFYIIDHGKGIKEKDIPYIFDRFYCADQSRTNKTNFGLGLSIAKELATILKGNIGYYDTPLGGATFYLTIAIK